MADILRFIAATSQSNSLAYIVLARESLDTAASGAVSCLVIFSPAVSMVLVVRALNRSEESTCNQCKALQGASRLLMRVLGSRSCGIVQVRRKSKGKICRICLCYFVVFTH